MMPHSPPAREGSSPPLELAGLYERERLPMIRLACLLVGSRWVAEEIVQDAFVVVGERWSTIENPGGYLRSTVVNGCRMAHRRRRTELGLALLDVTSIEPAGELVELRSALDRLSERQRTSVVLRYFVDLPYAEIAGLLGCREATVRSIVNRSLRILRKELS
jgi:RNA polymerase sigma factor (sigma-70 family)